MKFARRAASCFPSSTKSASVGRRRHIGKLRVVGTSPNPGAGSSRERVAAAVPPPPPSSERSDHRPPHVVVGRCNSSLAAVPSPPSRTSSSRFVREIRPYKMPFPGLAWTRRRGMGTEQLRSFLSGARRSRRRIRSLPFFTVAFAPRTRLFPRRATPLRGEAPGARAENSPYQVTARRGRSVRPDSSSSYDDDGGGDASPAPGPIDSIRFDSGAAQPSSSPASRPTTACAARTLLPVVEESFSFWIGIPSSSAARFMKISESTPSRRLHPPGRGRGRHPQNIRNQDPCFIRTCRW